MVNSDGKTNSDFGFTLLLSKRQRNKLHIHLTTMFGPVSMEGVRGECSADVAWRDERHLNATVGHFRPQAVKKRLQGMFGRRVCTGSAGSNFFFLISFISCIEKIHFLFFRSTFFPIC